MATKILIGVVAALSAAGVGVYVAHHDACPFSCHGDSQTSSMAVSEGNCCASHLDSCCSESTVPACCAGSACPTEALAACTGTMAIATAEPAKPARAKGRVGSTSAE